MAKARPANARSARAGGTIVPGLSTTSRAGQFAVARAAAEARRRAARPRTRMLGGREVLASWH